MWHTIPEGNLFSEKLRHIMCHDLNLLNPSIIYGINPQRDKLHRWKCY